MGSMLEQYGEIAPRGTVDFLRRLAQRVAGKRMIHVNSTRHGGGVAEILHRLLPLLEEVGVKTCWEVMTGSGFFYRTTKNFHNGLQGSKQRITPDMYEAYLECNRETAKRLLNEPDRMAALGRQAKEYARHRFLITRHLQDNLSLIILLSQGAR